MSEVQLHTTQGMSCRQKALHLDLAALLQVQGLLHNFPLVNFNNVPVKRCSIQKHLGIHLDEKLNFSHHVNEKTNKASKGIRMIKNLSNTLPRDALLTIYKSMVILSMTNHKMSPSAVN